MAKTARFDLSRAWKFLMLAGALLGLAALLLPFSYRPAELTGTNLWNVSWPAGFPRPRYIAPLLFLLAGIASVAIVKGFELGLAFVGAVVGGTSLILAILLGVKGESAHLAGAALVLLPTGTALTTAAAIAAWICPEPERTTPPGKEPRLPRPQASIPLTADARCAGHPDASAATCDRCGNFFCAACAAPSRGPGGVYCSACAPKLAHWVLGEVVPWEDRARGLVRRYLATTRMMVVSPVTLFRRMPPRGWGSALGIIYFTYVVWAGALLATIAFSMIRAPIHASMVADVVGSYSLRLGVIVVLAPLSALLIGGLIWLHLRIFRVPGTWQALFRVGAYSSPLAVVSIPLAIVAVIFHSASLDLVLKAAMTLWMAALWVVGATVLHGRSSVVVTIASLMGFLEFWLLDRFLFGRVTQWITSVLLGA